MPQISRVLRSYTCKVTGRKGYGWWCPGCKCAHYINTDGGDRPVWGFDGDLELPTIMPSYREFIPAMPALGEYPEMPEQIICHCWVQQGHIEFLNDCSHDLRGFRPMVDLSTITDYEWGYD